MNEVQSPISETSSGDKQELPLSNFQKPNLLLQKEKKRRHSAVEDVAEEEGTRVETHNSILSLVDTSLHLNFPYMLLWKSLIESTWRRH
ncbi:ankyrin repeat-containing 2B [Prunus dulcis]|uniref:Ankyrin repeat-containing 2B n=1 Tax=Prunus dulcis TaxID=3755 RepID=A0A5H2XLS1_PRUDU|nr:ankyrin repeat-containing 2B [Prunus dulcis]